MSEDFDDFLGLDSEENIAPVAEATVAPVVSDSHEEIEEPKESNVEAKGKGHPILMGVDYPEAFMELVKKAYEQYDRLPVLNYNALYQELSDLSVKSSATPTLQVLNDEIQKVQAAKDRLSEIFVDVLQCFNVKKRVVDTLVDAWGKFSKEKNGEARKGDARYRLGNFLMNFAEVESLSKVCNHILKNLDSLHDSLSRRITINQLLLKMNDMGRGALPDYRFSKEERDDVNDLFGEKKEVDETESLKADEETF